MKFEISSRRGSSKWSVKPVFPALYMLLFITSVVLSILALIATAPPEASQAFAEERSAKQLSILINFFAIFVSVFIVLQYIHLELLEHRGQFNSLREHIPLWMCGVEFLLRFSLAAIIALKIIKWSDLSQLSTFLLSATTILFSWLVFVTFFLKARAVDRLAIALHFGITFVSILIFGLMSDPTLQIEYAVLLICALPVACMFIFFSIYKLIDDMWPEPVKILKNYLVKWN